MKKTIPVVVAIKSKKEDLLIRAAIFKNKGRVGALWLIHPEQTDTYYCSYCHYAYHKEAKKLPSSCPQCNADMTKEAKTKDYLEIITALKEERGSNVFFFDEGKNSVSKDMFNSFQLNNS